MSQPVGSRALGPFAGFYAAPTTFAHRRHCSVAVVVTCGSDRTRSPVSSASPLLSSVILVVSLHAFLLLLHKLTRKLVCTWGVRESK